MGGPARHATTVPRLAPTVWASHSPPGATGGKCTQTCGLCEQNRCLCPTLRHACAEPCSSATVRGPQSRLNYGTYCSIGSSHIAVGRAPVVMRRFPCPPSGTALIYKMAADMMPFRGAVAAACTCICMNKQRLNHSAARPSKTKWSSTLCTCNGRNTARDPD